MALKYEKIVKSDHLDSVNDHITTRFQIHCIGPHHKISNHVRSAPPNFKRSTYTKFHKIDRNEIKSKHNILTT